VAGFFTSNVARGRDRATSIELSGH
jgi:hypothetical protein